MRKSMALLAAAALPLTFVACDDSDDDGNIDNPDLDPGEGTGLPEEEDVDVDPGEGTGLPGGEDTGGDDG